MDSLGEKSTVSPTWDHFVILLSHRTSPPIEYATRVDAGKQQPVSCLQTASLHTRLHDAVEKTGGFVVTVWIVAPWRARCYTEARLGARGGHSRRVASGPARSWSARIPDTWRRIKRRS